MGSWWFLHLTTVCGVTGIRSGKKQGDEARAMVFRADPLRFVLVGIAGGRMFFL